MDIGKEEKEITFEPIPESVPVEEPTPVIVPEEEPAGV